MGLGALAAAAVVLSSKREEDSPAEQPAEDLYSGDTLGSDDGSELYTGPAEREDWARYSENFERDDPPVEVLEAPKPPDELERMARGEIREAEVLEAEGVPVS